MGDPRDRDGFEAENRWEEYNRYLKSDHWRQLRDQKIKEVGRECENCESGRRIHCHHIRYKNLVDVLTEDLAVLCKQCHRIYHKAEQVFEMHAESVAQIRIMIKDFIETDYGVKWIEKHKIKKASKPNKHFKKMVSKIVRNLKNGGYSPETVGVAIGEFSRLLNATGNIRLLSPPNHLTGGPPLAPSGQAETRPIAEVGGGK